jgi:CheY-like chemotaxis protein
MKADHMHGRLPCRLLIVEDEEIDQMVYKLLLKNALPRALQTTFANSGADARRLLESSEFDCMLLDHELSDMTGFDLIDSIMARDAALPCATVIVTGNKDERLAAEAARRGITTVLLKSQVDQTRLIQAIDAALGIAATPPPMPPAPASQGQAPPSASAPAPPVPEPLTLAGAKLALARSLGIEPAAIEIIIRA